MLLKIVKLRQSMTHTLWLAATLTSESSRVKVRVRVRKVTAVNGPHHGRQTVLLDL